MPRPDATDDVTLHFLCKSYIYILKNVIFNRVHIGRKMLLLFIYKTSFFS